MAELVFTGLTMAQAAMLAHWYEGQGEQDADVWFDINGVPCPQADVQTKGWLALDEANQRVTMKCR